MNKFTRSITAGSAVLGDRAAIVGAQAKRAQEDLVRKFEGEIDGLKMKVIQMCDISPDNTQSLKPTGKVVDNPIGWVNDLHHAKKQIALAEIELKIARETLAEWFADEPVQSNITEKL